MAVSENSLNAPVKMIDVNGVQILSMDENVNGKSRSKEENHEAAKQETERVHSYGQNQTPSVNSRETMGRVGRQGDSTLFPFSSSTLSSPPSSSLDTFKSNETSATAPTGRVALATPSFSKEVGVETDSSSGASRNVATEHKGIERDGEQVTTQSAAAPPPPDPALYHPLEPAFSTSSTTTSSSSSSHPTPSITATSRSVRGRLINSSSAERATTAAPTSFDSASAAPILLLFITSGSRTLSSETLVILDRLGAIHIDIPSDVVARHWHQRAPPKDFGILEHFIVDEMSKRRYSQFLMDEVAVQEDSSRPNRSLSYCNNDIAILCEEGHLMPAVDLIVDDEEVSQSSGDSTDASMPTTPQKGARTDSMAVQVFAEAIQELTSECEQKKGLFFVEGSLSEVAAVVLDSVEREESSSMISNQTTLEPIAISSPIPSPKTPTRSRRSGGGLKPLKSLTISPTKDTRFTTLHVYESPERGEVEGDDEEQVQRRHYTSPLPTILTAIPNLASPAPAPSKTNRPGRPMLKRLDTSEMIKKVGESSSAAQPSYRRQSTSSPRLALNTNVNPHLVPVRSNTGIDDHPDPKEARGGGEEEERQRNLESVYIREARRGSEPGGVIANKADSALAKSLQSSPHSPTRSFSLSTGSAASASFEPSEIIPNFLYLGSEIATSSEVNYLKNTLGIKRVLNAAWEIEDGGGKHLNLHNERLSGIEKYKKIPLKDTVEAKGVQRYIEEACAFLDDARLHSAPVYVHCKAGKSRSVMLVMAYLIHSNRWTLQKSYSYVVERRRTVSPNIGFVAELMAFEEKRLQTKHRGGSFSRTTSGKVSEDTKENDDDDDDDDDDSKHLEGGSGNEKATTFNDLRGKRESMPASVSISASRLSFWDPDATSSRRRSEERSRNGTR